MIKCTVARSILVWSTKNTIQVLKNMISLTDDMVNYNGSKTAT